MLALLDIVARQGARAWRADTLTAAWAEIVKEVRASARFRQLLHGPTFLKSARAIKHNLEQLVGLPMRALNFSHGQADVTALASRVRGFRDDAAVAADTGAVATGSGAMPARAKPAAAHHSKRERAAAKAGGRGKSKGHGRGDYTSRWPELN